MSYFVKNSEPFHETRLPFMAIKALAKDEYMLIAEYRLFKDNVLPSHSHAERQTGYLVSGKLSLRIGSEERIVEKGDTWLVPPWVEHGADILEDSVAVEVFTPPRKALLE